MIRFPVRTFIPLLAAMLPALLFATASGAPANLIKPLGPTSSERAIFDALEGDTNFEFIETPLRDAIDYFEDLHGIQIEFDNKALDDVGIDGRMPITGDLSGVSLRSGLQMLLQNHELTFALNNEVLLITTPEAAAKLANVRIYDVSALLEPGEPAETLARVLAETLQEPHFSNVGRDGDSKIEKTKRDPKSPRSISSFRHLLIVRDTTIGHYEVAEVLTALREGIVPKPPQSDKNPE